MPIELNPNAQPAAPSAKVDLLDGGPSIQQVLTAMIHDLEGLKRWAFQTKEKVVTTTEYLNELNLEVQHMKLIHQISLNWMKEASEKLGITLPDFPAPPQREVPQVPETVQENS